MSAHTPGPWLITASPGSSGGIAHAGGYVAFTAIPRQVSDQRNDGESWLDMRNRTQAERESVNVEEKANARLITAAPDLLKSAMALGCMPEGYCFCSQDRVGDESKVHEPECRDMRAAIAKATASSQPLTESQQAHEAQERG